MWSILALGAIERVIHHWIDLDSLTRIQLNQLQGKMLRVVIASPQLSVDICFDEDEVRLEPTITGHPEQPSVFEQRPFDPEHAFSEATATLKVENIVELAKLFWQKRSVIFRYKVIIACYRSYSVLFSRPSLIWQHIFPHG